MYFSGKNIPDNIVSFRINKDPEKLLFWLENNNKKRNINKRFVNLIVCGYNKEKDKYTFPKAIIGLTPFGSLVKFTNKFTTLGLKTDKCFSIKELMSEEKYQ